MHKHQRKEGLDIDDNFPVIERILAPNSQTSILYRSRVRVQYKSTHFFRFLIY